MNQELREQLSALIDNELDRDRARFLLKRAEHDTDLVALWQRWHFAGEAMRGTALPLSRDFLRGIHERLDGEDASGAVAAPRHTGMLRWGGGFAVAASVALVALLMVQPETPVLNTLPGSELANATVPVKAGLEAASVVAPSPYRVQDLRPPYRLDAQVVAAREADRYGTQARFDPDYEAYWLRHQQAVNDRADGVAMPWMAPLHPDVAQAAGTR